LPAACACSAREWKFEQGEPFPKPAWFWEWLWESLRLFDFSQDYFFRADRYEGDSEISIQDSGQLTEHWF
jgi:hypothetical protein